MHEWVIMVLPFGKEQARGKLRSQDSFLQSQVAAYLKQNKNALFEYITDLKASRESQYCLGSQEFKGKLRKIFIT